MSQIVLIRAGQTDYEADSRLLGMLELPLNKAGMQQVQEAVSEIRKLDLEIGIILATPGDFASSKHLTSACPYGKATYRVIVSPPTAGTSRILSPSKNRSVCRWKRVAVCTQSRWSSLVNSCHARTLSVASPSGTNGQLYR